jgi:predicted nucleic-acid-binding protein
VSGLAGSLDANALLRLILNDVPAQAAAVAALLIRNPRSRYAVADLAVVEVEYALRTHYGFSREQIQDTLGNVVDHPSIHADAALMKRIFQLYTAHPQLSFTDCCLAAHAEVDNAKPLWTFDQKLAKQSDGAAQLIAA